VKMTMRLRARSSRIISSRLRPSSCSSAHHRGLSSWPNQGLRHGFTEILYAFTSAAANNGSAFAGLKRQQPGGTKRDAGLDHAGRTLLHAHPVLPWPANLAQKKSVPPSPGTFL